MHYILIQKFNNNNTIIGLYNDFKQLRKDSLNYIVKLYMKIHNIKTKKKAADKIKTKLKEFYTKQKIININNEYLFSIQLIEEVNKLIGSEEKKPEEKKPEEKKPEEKKPEEKKPEEKKPEEKKPEEKKPEEKKPEEKKPEEKKPEEKKPEEKKHTQLENIILTKINNWNDPIPLIKIELNNYL